MTLAERLASTEVDGRAADIKIEVDNRIADFIASIKDGENRLHLARRKVLDAEHGLAQFKVEHRLKRPAEFPDSHWLSFGIIAVIVLVEGVLNAFFLGEAQPDGIFGGFRIAALISLANVLIGIAAGRWACSGLTHRRWYVKIGGAVLLCATVAVLIAINLGTAHYRAALLAGNYRTPEIAAMETLFERPLDLGDLKSWLLFVVGSITSVIAAVEGFRWDDAYPGYGRRDRLHRRSVKAYQDVMRDVMDEIDEIKDDAVAEARDLKDGIDRRREMRARVLASRQRLAVNLADHMRHLEGVLHELIGAYREANAQARSTPVPERFSRMPPFDAGSVLVSEDLDARKADTAYQRVNETLLSAIERLLAEHADAQRRFQSVEKLTYEEVTGAAQRKPPIAA